MQILRFVLNPEISQRDANVLSGLEPIERAFITVRNSFRQQLLKNLELGNVRAFHRSLRRICPMATYARLTWFSGCFGFRRSMPYPSLSMTPRHLYDVNFLMSETPVHNCASI